MLDARMNPIGVSVVFGAILSIVVIYFLRPLNAGAVALIVTLCVGLCAAIGVMISALRKKK